MCELCGAQVLFNKGIFQWARLENLIQLASQGTGGLDLTGASLAPSSLSRRKRHPGVSWLHPPAILNSLCLCRLGDRWGTGFPHRRRATQ